jgi:hypothetical protein
MQQCCMIMQDDAHDQVLVTFNIWDVTHSSSFFSQICDHSTQDLARTSHKCCMKSHSVSDN